MARVMLWRMLALAAVPVAILAVHGRFRQTDNWEPRATFGSHLNRNAQRLEARIATIEWIDREMRRVATSEQAVRQGNVTVLTRDSRKGPLLADRFVRQARAELDRVQGASPNDVRVVVLVGEMPQHSHGRQAQWSYGSAPLSNDVWNPCVMAIRPEEPVRMDSVGRFLPILAGQCALAAAFGEPGPAIRDWIARLGLRPGQPAFARAAGVERDEHGRLLLNTTAQIETRSYGGFGLVELDVLSCRKGDLASCHDLFWSRFGTGLRGDMLWWLIQRDDDAFARFWRAGGSIDDAVRTAFGAPLDHLAREFSRERIVVAQAGPELPKHSWMALFWIAAPLALATLRARRQTVSG